MLNPMEKFALTEIAEQYLEEAPTDHGDQCGEKCLGCRKEKLAKGILAFIRDFDDGAQRPSLLIRVCYFTDVPENNTNIIRSGRRRSSRNSKTVELNSYIERSSCLA